MLKRDITAVINVTIIVKSRLAKPSAKDEKK
jgi:hypothetical protein